MGTSDPNDCQHGHAGQPARLAPGSGPDRSRAAFLRVGHLGAPLRVTPLVLRSQVAYVVWVDSRRLTVAQRHDVSSRPGHSVPMRQRRVYRLSAPPTDPRCLALQDLARLSVGAVRASGGRSHVLSLQGKAKTPDRSAVRLACRGSIPLRVWSSPVSGRANATSRS